jgi:Xaa-Pro aminopeptidase
VSDWPTFFQLPHFHYLTGFDEGNAVLLMVKRGGGSTSTMFVPQQAEFQARILGKRTPALALQRTIGIAGRDIGGLRTTIDSLVADWAAAVRRARRAHGGLRGRGLAVARLATRLAAACRAPHAEDRVARQRRLTAMRATKSAAEVSLLRRAVDISTTAHVEAMKAVAPGCGEYEIQALLEGTFRRLGGDRPRTAASSGSGPNANILHYMANTRVMRDGELLLIDAASSFDHYAA